MILNTQDFTTLVSNMVTSVQGFATQALNLTVGSVLRAILEAVAGIQLWLEGLILQVQSMTRAATSTGSDLDSWVNDFGVTRLPAVAATGEVVFSRYTATAQAVVPIGATVQNSSGTVVYTVIVDTTNANYSATLGGYVAASGTSSISVTVQCNTSGTVGNAQIGAITVITTPIVGFDTVNNTVAFTTGENAETDAALRVRFVAYIDSLYKATKTAVVAAIEGVQTGLQYVLVENTAYSGSTKLGYFYVVINDGSGSPPSSLLTAVYNAINAVRGLTIQFNVFAPVVVDVTVSMVITVQSGYTLATVEAAVASALQSYINGLTIGQSLYYTQLYAVAYGVTGVLEATGLTINGGTSDIAATNHQVIMCPTTPTVT